MRETAHRYPHWLATLLLIRTTAERLGTDHLRRTLTAAPPPQRTRNTVGPSELLPAFRLQLPPSTLVTPSTERIPFLSALLHGKNLLRIRPIGLIPVRFTAQIKDAGIGNGTKVFVNSVMTPAGRILNLSTPAAGAL